MDNKLHTCCFFGHRRIEKTPELTEKLKKIVEDLNVSRGVHTFLFGSKSEFNSLCLRVVTEIKTKYPHITRVYVRAGYPDISDCYKEYLLECYEETYFLEKIRCAGRAAYVERNQEMINQSQFCVVYYDKAYLPPPKKYGKGVFREVQPKSGTGIAYAYAVQQKLQIINVILQE